MTENEARLILDVRISRFGHARDVNEALEIAKQALKEIQLYKDNKLCLIPKDVYSRQCSELDMYKEIGTLEECQEAVEKQKPKAPDYEADVYADGYMVYDTWTCPNCGKKYEVGHDDYKHCPECGQAIDDNLEGMEDESEEE